VGPAESVGAGKENDILSWATMPTLSYGTIYEVPGMMSSIRVISKFGPTVGVRLD
jgi:hypothetical protein